MNESVDLGSHPEIRGCILDYTRIKTNDCVDISLGYLCDECQRKLEGVMTRENFLDLKRVISQEWIGSVKEFGSVAYNLKHSYKFDIGKDSDFNKTAWEGLAGRIVEILSQCAVAAVSALIGLIVGIPIGRL